MVWETSRRNLLRASAAVAGAGLLQACGSSSAPQQPGGTAKPLPPRKPAVSRSGENVIRIIASSGFANDSSRIELGLRRLYDAGFVITNQEAAYRRYQRFAGTDAERIADFQQVANGRVATPKMLLGLRGGYGASRMLPHIDWASLGARMRERGTLFMGFSDVCALQLALLAKGNMPSFAGPMLYSEFGKPVPSVYTMDSFIRGTTQPQNVVTVSALQRRDVNVEGVFWGGNLSVLASLVGTPYMPDIKGGILFLEDVGEQPYRIERMLQTLYMAGVLSKQQAIVFGDFRMGSIRDAYDSTYDLGAVINLVQRAAKVPVLTGFPFGHITNKATFPLGGHARITPNGSGYQVAFSDYPTLNAATLSLNMLLPPVEVFSVPVMEDSGDLE